MIKYHQSVCRQGQHMKLAIERVATASTPMGYCLIKQRDKTN